MPPSLAEPCRVVQDRLSGTNASSTFSTHLASSVVSVRRNRMPARARFPRRKRRQPSFAGVDAGRCDERGLADPGRALDDDGTPLAAGHRLAARPDRAELLTRSRSSPSSRSAIVPIAAIATSSARVPTWMRLALQCTTPVAGPRRSYAQLSSAASRRVSVAVNWSRRFASNAENASPSASRATPRPTRTNR